MKPRPFLGVDGEGAGRDESGRQLYQLICAGENVLAADDYLETTDCLEFILSLPKKPILVGYYFNYDVTMMLRDLPRERMAHLCDKSYNYGGTSPYTWWREYGLEWWPGLRFRVCRLDKHNKPVRHSVRTIYDVSGHFRMPFLEALKLYGVGSAAERKIIAAGKAARGGALLPDDALRYCQLETRLLAQLMERLRDACEAAGYVPRTWDGAAKITAQMLRQHQIPRGYSRPVRPDVSRETHRYPAKGKRWLDAVMKAQFGGRIECRMIGDVKGPVHVYDLASAYPAALLTLPCPVHTVWHPFKGEPKGWQWWLGRGRYRETSNTPLWGALPARNADHSICYPLSAEGAWWSPELMGLGDRFEYRGGWGADRVCRCRPWDWVEGAYQRRRQLGDERGYPIKVALAAINGKLSQRKGDAPWRDIPASGLLMSWVRRRMRDALALAGEHGVMVMTDAIATTAELKGLHCGDGLGEWRHLIARRLHVVGSGVYWTDADTRSRGLSRSRLSPVIPAAEGAWRRWIKGGLAPIGPPAVNVPIDVFIGPRTALEMDYAILPGTWQHMEYPLSYDWFSKRERLAYVEGGAVITEPPRQHVKSIPYNPEHLTEAERLMQLVEATDE